MTRIADFTFINQLVSQAGQSREEGCTAGGLCQTCCSVEFKNLFFIRGEGFSHQNNNGQDPYKALRILGDIRQRSIQCALCAFFIKPIECDAERERMTSSWNIGLQSRDYFNIGYEQELNEPKELPLIV